MKKQACKVGFYDEENEYQFTEELVYAEGYDESNATVIEEFIISGCTNKKDIVKLAKHHMSLANIQGD